MVKRNSIISIILSVFLAFLVMISSVMPVVASADDSSSSLTIKDISNTSIEEDFTSMNIDTSIYQKNEGDVPSIMTVMESCYSNKLSLAEYYGLYFYVYNPSEKVISINSQNVVKIGLSCADDSVVNDEDYSDVFLEVVTCSDNHRFYKMRAKSPSAYLSYFQNCFFNHFEHNDKKRCYSFSSLGIVYSDETAPVISEIDKQYIFIGFARGCGANVDAASTLSCMTCGADTLNLVLNHTTWRSNATSSAISTCYFSIPKEYLEDYEKISKIRAQWYEYKTKPIFVTNDKSAAGGVLTEDKSDDGVLVDKIGKTVAPEDDLQYRVVWEEFKTEKAAPDSVVESLLNPLIYKWLGSKYTDYVYSKHYNGLQYTKYDDDDELDDMFMWEWFEKEKDAGLIPVELLSFYSYAEDVEAESRIDWLFLVNDGENVENITDYNISPQAVEEYMKWYTEKFPEHEKDETGQFSVELFEESIDEERQKWLVQEDSHFVSHEFTLEDTIEDIIQYEQGNWFQSLIGYNPTSINDVNPFVVLKKSDLEAYNANNADSIASFEKNYFVDDDNTNVASGSVLKACKEMTETDENVVVLFRFAETDYYSSVARFDDTSAWHDEDSSRSERNIVEYNGYVAQETLFLDFDIISMTFLNNDFVTETVVPVVANPVNIIAGLTPPSDLEEDEDWWQKLVALIMIVLLVVFYGTFLAPFVNPIISMIIKGALKGILLVIKLVFKILTLPLRLLFGLFKR